tara:strand:+ start:2799 stop:2954 length:156 start_codon:yes stop_codon:yes gene_type:complete
MDFLHQGKIFTALDDLVEHLEQSNQCLARIEALLSKGNQNQKEEQTDDNQS